MKEMPGPEKADSGCSFMPESSVSMAGRQVSITKKMSCTNLVTMIPLAMLD